MRKDAKGSFDRRGQGGEADGEGLQARIEGERGLMLEELCAQRLESSPRPAGPQAGRRAARTLLYYFASMAVPGRWFARVLQGAEGTS